MFVQIVHWHQQFAHVRYYSDRLPGHGGSIGSTPLYDVDSNAADSGSEDDEEDAESEAEDDAGQGLVYLRKVLITPLRVLPYAATPEESNRILQQYTSFRFTLL